MALFAWPEGACKPGVDVTNVPLCHEITQLLNETEFPEEWRKLHEKTDYSNGGPYTYSSVCTSQSDYLGYCTHN